MEFWGVEVTAGQTVKCEPGEEKYLHLSQASLGEVKKDKGNLSVPLFLTVDGKKLVIGTLFPDKCAHISYDLVFEKEFELSHSWKDGSVYFTGYKTVISESNSGTDSEDGVEEEDIPVLQKADGKLAKGDLLNASVKRRDDVSASKATPKVEETTKPEATDEDEDDDDESDEDMVDSDDFDENDEDEDESSDEEENVTLKKTENVKKRPAGSGSKASTPEKKAKLVTPVVKTGASESKKGSHTATPYPTKQAGKTFVNDAKVKQQTPKSGGSVSCKSCSKTFNTEIALQSHTKAKHSAAK